MGHNAFTSSSSGNNAGTNLGFFLTSSCNVGFCLVCLRTEEWIYSCVMLSVAVGSLRLILLAIEKIPTRELEDCLQYRLPAQKRSTLTHEGSAFPN